MSEWYIAHEGQPLGPYTAQQMLQFAAEGRVTADKMIWKNGLPNWLTLAQAWPMLGGGGPPPAPAPGMAPPGGAPGQAQADPGWGLQGFADRVADLAGVERLEGFSIRDLLSASFKKYSQAEMEEHVAFGIPEKTPKLSEIEPGWPKPWMFVRMLAGISLVFIGFYVMLKYSSNPKLLPGLIVVGSFAVPIATLIFFYEMNSPRNISLYLVLRNVMIGGLVSIAFSLFLFENTAWLGWMGAPLAGLVEETGKITTVFVLAMRLDPKRYPYILNGMLFGAAVGAGFAAFESAGYAFEIMFSPLFREGAQGGIDLGSGTFNIVLRGALAPFGHIVWTALASGALWRVKLDQQLTPAMVFAPRTLKMLGTVMCLHMAWNTSWLATILPFFTHNLILGFIAWVLAFSMMQTGLKQIKAAQQSLASEGAPALSGATMVLKRAGPIGKR